MVSKARFSITSEAPILMHNGRLADPLNPIVKVIKTFTTKRKKTDQDHEIIAKLEWLGSLYTTKKMDVKVLSDGTIDIIGGGAPAIPGDMIYSCLHSAAKKQRMGKDYLSGVFMSGSNIPLQYSGTKDISEMINDINFFDVRAVRVNSARIMRTRPIFDEWSLEFEVMYDDGIVDGGAIQNMVYTAGALIGIGDYRPRYGRFRVL